MPNHPDRVLSLQGAPNFRDLGGYAGADGRHVRWRRLYRSGHLGGLTESDLQRVGALGLTHAFDFRGVEERETARCAVPGLAQRPLSIEPSVVQEMRALIEAGGVPDGERVAALMTDLYRDIVNDHAHRLAELFDHLVQAEGALVFHCTAGKDRTGIAAALILLTLGVPRPVVMQDYLLTQALMPHPPAPSAEFTADAQAVLWGVQAGFLDAALDTIDTAHGGVEAYAAGRLGLGTAGVAALRERFLVDA
ncbi:MAG: tyrosine-protein phosphatase [Aquabacterium sp.]